MGTPKILELIKYRNRVADVAKHMGQSPTYQMCHVTASDADLIIEDKGRVSISVWITLRRTAESELFTPEVRIGSSSSLPVNGEEASERLRLMQEVMDATWSIYEEAFQGIQVSY